MHRNRRAAENEQSLTRFILPQGCFAPHFFLLGHPLCLGRLISSENNESESQLAITSEMDIAEEREFHQRVQLLTVMVKAVAENRLAENFRKKALQENLDRICDTLVFKFHIKDLEFLKVA